MLTPLELNGKTFSKGFRGYDTDEVNQFFSQISRDYERLYQDNVELKDSVERVSAKLEYYQRMESTMQSTLVVAQETADEVKKNSLQKAQVLAQETELACNKQKESAVAFCNKLRADTEAEITRMKSEADAYAEKVRKMADEYASKTRGDADEYGKSTRTDADSYASGLRSKTDSSTSKLREETQSFVDKMKSLAEIEVAKMKVEAEDNCKSQLADSREQARTLTAEASAHANQVMADANQQSQNIVAEATQKAHEMIASAQKQSQDMMAEARQKSQDMVAEATQKSQNMIAEATEKSQKIMAEATEQSRSLVHEATERSRTMVQEATERSNSMVSEATERSNSMVKEATERSQKMVFVAETKAAAAMDTYNTMVTKANSQSKQLKSLLQSQLSLYDNFEAEYAIEQMVQPKLNAVKQAEPVLETKVEPVFAGTDDAVATVVETGKEEPVKAEFVAAEVKPAEEFKPVAAVAAEKPSSPEEFAGSVSQANTVESESITAQDETKIDAGAVMPAKEPVAEEAEVKPAVEAVNGEAAKINFTEAAKANAVAADDTTVVAAKDAAAAVENTDLNESDKSSAAEGNGYGRMRKPLFSRFNPRGSMVFNRNSFPRKNADLRVALSELQKSAEPKPHSDDINVELKNEDANSEQQNANPKPEGNKEA